MRLSTSDGRMARGYSLSDAQQRFAIVLEPAAYCRSPDQSNRQAAAVENCAPVAPEIRAAA